MTELYNALKFLSPVRYVDTDVEAEFVYARTLPQRDSTPLSCHYDVTGEQTAKRMGKTNGCLLCTLFFICVLGQHFFNVGDCSTACFFTLRTNEPDFVIRLSLMSASTRLP